MFYLETLHPKKPSCNLSYKMEDLCHANLNLRWQDSPVGSPLKARRTDTTLVPLLHRALTDWKKILSSSRVGHVPFLRGLKFSEGFEILKHHPFRALKRWLSTKFSVILRGGHETCSSQTFNIMLLSMFSFFPASHSCHFFPRHLFLCLSQHQFFQP